MNKCFVEGCDKQKDVKQGSKYCTMHRIRRSRHKSIDLPVRKQLPEGIAKICKHHGPISAEHVYVVPNSNWLNCKICKSERSAAYHYRNPGRHKTATRNNYYLREDNISIPKVDYEKMLLDQGGVCAICKNPETRKPKKITKWVFEEANQPKVKRLAIDHQHGSTKVRGLLCNACNTGIGQFKDDPKLLQSAINYLKSHE